MSSLRQFRQYAAGVISGVPGYERAASRPDRGFVLIVVIFVTALLALLALGFSASVRSHIRLAASSIESAKAEAIADAGIQIAALSMIATQGTPLQRRFPINGTPASCAIGEAAVTLRVQDAGGRININLAGERLLLALFIGLSGSRDAASRATDSILDYRDTDSDRRPNGAEKPDYVAAGRPLGPKNGPFDTIEELNQVLGLDPALIAAARPFVTVHSQTAGLDPRAASPALMAMLARGAAELPARPGALSADSGVLPPEFAIGSPQRVFQVTSEGMLPGGAVFVRESVIELQSSRSGVPAYKMWRRGVSAGPPPDLSVLPPC